MRKIFLYLYPIEEYQINFLHSDKDYDIRKVERPFIALNECIEKRYREKGYEVIIAIYPNKEVYGIKMKQTDKIIYTDVTFEEASAYKEDGSEKEVEEIKYPDEEYLASQIGEIDEIIVGGFHYSDCVKKVAEHFYKKGINVLVDLELTDLFFHLYRQTYFEKETYNPGNYKQYIIAQSLNFNEDINSINEQINIRYSSPVYQLNKHAPTVTAEEIAETLYTSRFRR